MRWPPARRTVGRIDPPTKGGSDGSCDGDPRGAQCTARRRRHSRAAAGRDARGRATVGAGRNLQRRARGRRGPANRPAARAGRFRGPVDAGDPRPRHHPSSGRPRPAWPRRLRGDGGRARRRAIRGVGERVDRSDMQLAARPRWAHGRRLNRGSVPGWCSWTRSDWANSGPRQDSPWPCSGTSHDPPHVRTAA
jgi:hypothetical protein